MIENEMTVSVPLEVVKASEIEPKEVKWLWYPYISGKAPRYSGNSAYSHSCIFCKVRCR